MKQEWLNNLLNNLTHARHRELLVIEGSQNWQQDWLSLILQSLAKIKPDMDSIQIVNQIPSATRDLKTNQPRPILDKQLSQYLGQEVDLVIFDSAEGITPNNLAQATGMIRAGGLCVLLLQDNWITLPNPAMKPYLSHPYTLKDTFNGFRRFLNNQLQNHALILNEGNPLPNHPSQINPLNSLKTRTTEKNQPIQATEQQKQVITAVHSVAFGHRNRPLLLSADRGRGKSSALGFAVIELFKQGKQHVAITAESTKQTEQIFRIATKYATERFQDAKFNQKSSPAHNKCKMSGDMPRGGVFTLTTPGEQTFKIQFYAPDELVQTKKQFDILLVDEAAHLPLPLLKQLAETYKRIVFSTTLLGYEGSGMGFKLRFSKLLENWDYKNLQLKEPIRWNENDPLEQKINQSLFLNSAPYSVHQNIEELDYQPMPIAELIKRPQQLEQLFQLLNTAHYQTSPNNLMQILEDPNIVLWIATDKKQQIYAVLLAFKEGGITEVKANKRYRGHLAAQLLHLQTQQTYWIKAQSYRINRLAVHPEVQGNKIGTKLLSAFIKATKKETAIDYISASFATNPELINFWQKQEFKPAYLGIKRDKASATHSISMLLGLNKSAQEKIITRQKDYSTQFIHLLQSNFQQLDSAIALKILSLFKFKQSDFPHDYMNGQPYESISHQLLKWTIANPSKIEQLVEPIKTIWIEKVIQNIPWQTLVKKHHYQSRKQLEQDIRKNLHTMKNS